MPQMFPLLWFFILILILSSLITMNSSIHFSSSLNKTPSKIFKMSLTQLSWKW